MTDAPPPVDPTPETPGVPAGMYQNPVTGESHYWDGTNWAAAPVPEDTTAPTKITADISAAEATNAPSPTVPNFSPISLIALVV
ncbi:MAG: hypothetical protein ACKVOG_06380, partial [Rhodoglobus sp.]